MLRCALFAVCMRGNAARRKQAMMRDAPARTGIATA